MKQGILFLRRMGYPAQKMMKKNKEIRLFAVIFAVYVSSDCDMVTYEHYDFKKDVLIKVGKSVKMRGLFKPGKERTLQIKCNVRICAVVERDKKGKKRAVKITSIICSKVEGAGSRKICEES